MISKVMVGCKLKIYVSNTYLTQIWNIFFYISNALKLMVILWRLPPTISGANRGKEKEGKKREMREVGEASFHSRQHWGPKAKKYPLL